MHCAHPLVDAEVEPEVGVKVESHAQAEVKNILEEAEAEVESKAEAEVKSEFEFEFERRRSRPRWRLRLWCSPGGHPLHKWPWFGLAVSEFFCCFFVVRINQTELKSRLFLFWIPLVEAEVISVFFVVVHLLLGLD